MPSRWKRRGIMVALAPILLGVVSCAGPAATAQPAVEKKPATADRLQRVVRELLANQEAGRVRTVSGVGYVLAPITVFLADGEVSLLPSTPDLESDLARLQRQWYAGRRQPLSYTAFLTAFSRMTAQRNEIAQAGGESLIRFAKTDKKGRFTFEQVPEGRWLLVADMSSSVSTLLWAMPIDVGPQDPPPLALIDRTLLLEARKAQQDPATR